MSVWRVREIRELGKEGRVWSLGEKGLTVGRSSDCDIQLLSQSVENKHAVLEWSQKKESYVIRDLASVNGTYINTLPLRNGIAVLKHGDTIRFGYEKGHLFRLEEVAAALPPSPPPLQHPVTSTATATQTSPAGDPPPHKATTMVPPPTTMVPSPSTMVPAPSTMAVQYVPVSSQPHTIIIPAVQQALPYIMPQPMAYGYPAPLASPMHPHQLMQTPQHPGMVWQPISPTPSPAPSVQPTPPTPATRSEMTVEDIESESASQRGGSPSPRRDGRRPASATNTPSLSKASTLYGQPAWWGEEVRASASDSELGYSRPGSVILRDLDFEAVRVSTRKSQDSPVQSSAAEDLRKQAISNRASEHDMVTSWTVGFDSAGRRRKPPNINRPRPHRPRSADHSPSRARSVSPSRRSPGVSPQHGPTPHRRSLAGGASRPATKKPPSGVKRTGRRSTPILGKASKTPAKETAEVRAPVTREQVTAEPCPPSTPADAVSKPDHNLTYTTPSHLSSGGSHSHATASDLSMSSVSDQPPLASSPVLPTPPPLKCPSEAQIGQKGDATFVIAEGDRPGSARKQWGSNQSQPPTSLMLASIEARMRRLSRMAQSTLLSVREALGLDGREEGVSELPPSPTPLSNSQELPEWKFFNKEVDSIFRNIRSVERYLGEVGGAVAVCREGGAAKKEGEEEVDYEGDSESEDHMEPFPDSVEDAQWTESTTSSSDPEEPS